MVWTYYMPTRIVAGPGSLATIGTLARDLNMSRVLVVSDPVISQLRHSHISFHGRTE